MEWRLERERQVSRTFQALTQQKVDFVASVTHELRTPITSILGFAEELSDTTDDPNVREQVEVILRNATRLRGVIDDVLLVSKLSRGSAPADALPVTDAGLALQRSIEDAKHSIQQRHLRVAAEIEPDLPVHGREIDLTRVFTNILTNAIKFSPDRGTISVVAYRTDHQVVVTISDEGEGIADEDAVYAWLSALSALCYRKAAFQPGENVAVVGLGVLGLGAVALGPLFGARTIAIGNSPVRLEMATTVGAHAGFLYDDLRLDDFTRGEGVDLVILTANPWPAHRTALEIVRPAGRVAIVALSGRGEPPLDFNPLSMELFYNKGISLVAVSHRAGSNYPADDRDRFDRKNAVAYVLELMADGTLKPGGLVTHRMHYTEMATAYEMIDRREKSMLGVIFEWDVADA